MPALAEFVDDITVDISLLSRWDVTQNLNNELAEFDKTCERSIKVLRKQCRKIITKLLSTVSDDILING